MFERKKINNKIQIFKLIKREMKEGSFFSLKSDIHSGELIIKIVNFF